MIQAFEDKVWIVSGTEIDHHHLEGLLNCFKHSSGMNGLVVAIFSFQLFHEIAVSIDDCAFFIRREIVPFTNASKASLSACVGDQL